MSDQGSIPTAIPMETPPPDSPMHDAPEAEAGTEITEDKPKAQPKPQPKKPEPEFFEQKVNGQVRRYTREQLLAKASLGDAATERFEKAAQIEKKFLAHQEKMKVDFMEALLDPELGLSKDQIRSRFESWYKENFIDPETLSPEQRELNELKKYRQQKEEEEKSHAQTKAEQEERQAIDSTREEMQKEIIATLEISGLPKNRFTVGRLAYWQRQNLANGYDAPADVLVQQVKDERSDIIKSDLQTATIEQIQDCLGDGFEEFINKVRKYDLARLNKRFNGEAPEPAKEKRQAGGRITMSDVDRNLARIRRGY